MQTYFWWQYLPRQHTENIPVHLIQYLFFLEHSPTLTIGIELQKSCVPNQSSITFEVNIRILLELLEFSKT